MADIKHVDASNFDELVLKSSKPVLVDFWATWCGPCRMVAPIVEEIANENPNIDAYKLDIDHDQAIAVRYNVSAVPTLLLFKNGEVVAHAVGAAPKEALLKTFAQHFE